MVSDKSDKEDKQELTDPDLSDNEPPQEAPDDIHFLLDRASMGDADAASLFYSRFRTTNWIVPRRTPTKSLLNEAEYPSELYGSLAIATEDFTIVPIFSSARHLIDWAGSELPHRIVTGEMITNTLPEDWWIGVNPGQDVEKELSPWELKHIGLGPEGVKEIVAELFDYKPVRQATTCEVNPEEHEDLIKLLRKEGEANPDVESIFLLERSGLNIDEEDSSILMVGVAINHEAHEKLEEIQEAFSSCVNIALIGASTARVFTGIWGTQSLTLSIFAKSEPIYSKSPIED